MYEQKKRDKGYRSSEGILQLKETKRGDKKKDLTGYESSGKESRRVKEIMRFENSYGNIAFGSGPEKEMTILVSEKRRHNQPNVSNREKKLRESRQIQRPVSRGRVYRNNGSREGGAVAFQYHRDVSARGMLGRMQAYASQCGQETLRQMTPFLAVRQDWERRKALEERTRTLKENHRDKEAAELEKEKEHLNRELQEKEQMERKLRQKLAAAVKEMKKEDLFDFRYEMQRLSAVLTAETAEMAAETAEVTAGMAETAEVTAEVTADLTEAGGPGTRAEERSGEEEMSDDESAETKKRNKKE